MNVSESKLADCRPAAEDAASPRWRPGERGPQSLAVCRRLGVMRRAAWTVPSYGREAGVSGYHKVYGEATKRALEASVLTATDRRQRWWKWRDPAVLDVHGWRVRHVALDDGVPPLAVVRSHQG